MPANSLAKRSMLGLKRSSAQPRKGKILKRQRPLAIYRNWVPKGEMIIGPSHHADMPKVLAVERAAFGSDEDSNLVEDLMADASAKPLLSLLALIDNWAVAYMIKFFRPGILGSVTGKIRCADQMNRPEYWRE